MNEEMVTITKKQFEQMYDDALLLQCLQNAGVDNWDWYGEAYEEYERLNKEDE